MFTGPVNFRAASGEWEPIDSSLVASPRAGYAARNRANDWTVDLPRDLAGEPVRVVNDGTTIEFSLLGARGEPEVAGATGRYSEAMPGVTVRYDVLADAVKETLALSSADAGSRFRFAVATSAGVTARLARDGGIEFVRGDRVAMVMPPPVMWDSAPNAAESQQGSFSLTRTAGGYELTLSIDESWLRDPHRQFPVSVDPYLYPAPTRDCTLKSETPTTSFCGASNLQVGWGGTEDHRALLDFDVDDCLPSQVQVLNAYIGLYRISQQTGNFKFMQMERMIRPWTTGATWESYDGTNPWTVPGGDFSPPAIDRAGAPSGTNAWSYWVVSDLVQHWADDTFPEDGVVLKDSVDQEVVNVVGFSSSDAVNALQRPYMGIHYEEETAPPDRAELTVTGPLTTGSIAQDLHALVVKVNAGVTSEGDGNASQTPPPKRIDVYYDGVLDQQFALPTQSGGGYPLSWTGDVGPYDASPATMEPGPHTVQVVAYDTSLRLGAADSVTLSFTIQPNSAPPIVESGAVLDEAAIHYANTWGVSLTVANERVRFQDEVRAVQNSVVDALGAPFAGLWYEPAVDGRLRIGVKTSGGAPPSGPNVDAAKSVLQGAGLLGQTDFISRSVNYQDLLDEAAVLRGRLATLFSLGKISTGVRVASGQLVVHVATDVTPAESAQIDQAIALSVIPVLRLSTGSPSTAIIAGACKDLGEYFACGSPLRGGVLITVNDRPCTAGFNARSVSDGKRYLITAGHCGNFAQELDPWSVWSYADFPERQGTVHRSYWDDENCDCAIYHRSPDVEFPFRVRPWVAVRRVDDLEEETTTDSAYVIRGIARVDPQNDTVCTTSAPELPNGKHTDCGNIVETGDAVTVEGHELDNLGRIGGMCAVRGSSGGPIYKDHRAYGIVVAADEENVDDVNCTTWYQGIRRVQDQLNVEILTG